MGESRMTDMVEVVVRVPHRAAQEAEPPEPEPDPCCPSCGSPWPEVQYEQHEDGHAVEGNCPDPWHHPDTPKIDSRVKGWRWKPGRGPHPEADSCDLWPACCYLSPVPAPEGASDG